jgi:hypothetical protein
MRGIESVSVDTGVAKIFKDIRKEKHVRFKIQIAVLPEISNAKTTPDVPRVLVIALGRGLAGQRTVKGLARR